MSSRNNSPRPGGGGGAGPSTLRTSHLTPRSAASPTTATRRTNVGSATQTITPPDSASSRSVSPEPLVLRLRGAHDAGTGGSTSLRRRITWAEDVVDNEGLGRKSSKVCCIYHRPREFGESSSEEDSSDSDDSGGPDSGDDDGGARMSGNRRGRKSSEHDHNHGKDGGGGDGDGCGKEKGKGKRKPSPNAYEKMPRYHNTKGAQQQQ
ncbi:Type 1 phosphatases regulator ypi1 [Exophiala xenobiotica]|nr:Type 1 phosphatases regulator ypi1 [Exophiala xenobiotica]KAK5292904.1 Type 1 phosphatases regulator ypi1 [Exophiala xenobiotica]KAK5484506.1 Type 1 phosphatases regulator ypi1 [Exophiala xenobiotica]